MSPRVPAWVPPGEFEEYRLIKQIGQGGMGSVFLAHDQLLDRTVAIKFISAEPDGDSRARFLIEGRAAARLTHPNVVAVHRVGEIQGRPYIVTEYVRGKTLAMLDLPVPPRQALELGLQLARGLASAHRQGVVHRNLKPGNAVLTEDGVVKILDFGLAKLVPLGGGRAPEPEAVAAHPSPFHSVATLAPNASNETARLPAIPESARSLSSPLITPTPVTRVGAVVGTPHYMAPEVWQNLPSTPRADVYALGAVLYELVTGAPPHAEHDHLPLFDLGCIVRDEDVPSLATQVPNLDPRFVEVVNRCLRRDPGERYASGDEVREAFEHLALGPVARASSGGDDDPYPGLATFEADDRAVFFGRGSETRAIVERLRATHLVLVAGDSGVGKSSICRAGVLPLVSDGGLGEVRVWQSITVTVGHHPVAGLAVALAPLLGRDLDGTVALVKSDVRALVRELRANLRDRRGLLLFFDQLEELTTLSAADEASRIAELLREIGQGTPGLRALATVRGDYLTRVAALPGLADEAARALYLLGPLGPAAIKQAITGPALAHGVRFESPALVDELAQATAAAEGGLPLLQFALAELWQARDQKNAVITASALTAIGGVSGALARHADAVIAGLVPSLRPAARRVLMRLVTPEGTRARLDDNDLIGDDAGAATALAALVRGRLVQARDAVAGGDGAGSTYELAHEALLTGWGTLGRWLSEKQGSRVALRRLELAAAEWERLGHSDDALWGKRQLAEVQTTLPEDLQAREKRFLEAAKRRERTARWLRRGVFVGVPLLLAGAWLGLTLVDRHKQAELRATAIHDLRRKVDGRLAEGHLAASDAAKADAEALALERAAFAAFDSKDPSGGETHWAEAVVAARTADRAWTEAEHALEQARSLDPTRSDVTAEFADVLAARAHAADRTRQVAERDDLLARLALYDQDGARLARFNAPGSITLALTPDDALVRVQRYVRHGDRLDVEPVEQAVQSGSITLPPGSYRLTVAAEGRVTTRVPVVLEPGDSLTVAFTLPRLDDVPQGLVFVPPGRFLRGSLGDDGLRKGFFHTQPLHDVETPGYLIARHETTFGEWIAFLEALPPAERNLHTPRVQVSVGFRGGLALDRLGDGSWRLTIAPTETRYVARAGEPLRYAGRQKNVTQDWRKVPVAGVSFEDARAYAAWLDQSGRVPGARLCSEVEWERAARGADGRAFPRGDRLEPDDGNIDVTYGKSPAAFGLDEVGSHPDGQSPFGLDDTAGNVWELTTSAEMEGEVVAKGGSFYHDELSGNAANRELPESSLRDVTVGLRICADLR